MAEFIFATGIECSCPTIEGGRWRIDERDATGHDTHWREDLELVRELGLRSLRKRQSDGTNRTGRRPA